MSKGRENTGFAPPASGHAAAPGGAIEMRSFDDIRALAGEAREMVLKTHLENCFHLVSFEPGRIEFRPTDDAPPDLAGSLGGFLNANTGIRWVVTVSSETGEPTVAERRTQAQVALESEAAGHPMVKAVLDNFPDAKIAHVRARRD